MTLQTGAARRGGRYDGAAGETTPPSSRYFQEELHAQGP